jgi:uncharacterized membrane protein (DUF373 family)
LSDNASFHISSLDGSEVIDHTNFFRKVTDFIVTITLYILLVALIAGMLRILLDIRFAVVDSLEGGFRQIVANVLTLFIVIEFFKTFADYAKHERIKLTYITDATILIVMREITVGLYSQSFGYQMLFALSTLMLVLGILRVLAVRYSPEKV